MIDPLIIQDDDKPTHEAARWAWVAVIATLTALALIGAYTVATWVL